MEQINKLAEELKIKKHTVHLQELSSKKRYEEETGEILTEDPISWQKYKAWTMNQTVGNANVLTCEFDKTQEVIAAEDIRYFDCPICKNKEWILEVDEDGNEVCKICDCRKTRISLKRLYKSGLGSLVKKYTFDNYNTAEAWQRQIKETALRFLGETDKWFFVGGQVGCGKSMICTSVACELAKRGKSMQYMLWVDTSKKLKQYAMKEEIYQKMIDELKNVQVLYIDDFLKTESLNTPPTAADFNIAYEILNYRYNQENMITIISSEYSVPHITEMSEAIGSRIYEKSEGYNLYIKPDRNKNQRLKGMLEL